MLFNLINFLKKNLSYKKRFELQLKTKSIFNKLINKNIYAVFIDLNSYAPSFNYVEYLLYAKLISKNKSLFLIILPKENFSKVGVKEKKDYYFNLRVKTILKPLIELIIGKDATIIYAQNRLDMKPFFNLPSENKFPREASINKINDTYIYAKELLELMKKNKEILKIKANVNFTNFIKENLLIASKKKLISISIKYNTYRSHMNSNVEAWKMFGQWLRLKNYDVIYLSDIENLNILKQLNEQKFYSIVYLSSFDLEFRNAFYNLTNLNFITAGGLGSLLMHSDNNYVVTKFVSIKNKDAYGTGSLRSIKEQLGLDVNSQFPFSHKKQKILWEPNSENFENLKKIFKSFEHKI
jgi:hypothetical protein